jgi:hypothetical protein
MGPIVDGFMVAMYMLSANAVMARVAPIQYRGDRLSPEADISADFSLARLIHQIKKKKHAPAINQPIINFPALSHSEIRVAGKPCHARYAA